MDVEGLKRDLQELTQLLKDVTEREAEYAKMIDVYSAGLKRYRRARGLYEAGLITNRELEIIEADIRRDWGLP